MDHPTRVEPPLAFLRLQELAAVDFAVTQLSSRADLDPLAFLLPSPRRRKFLRR